MKNVKRFLVPVFLVLLVCGVYANSLGNGFVSDDISGIVETAHTWTFPSVAVTKTVIHAQMLVWYVVYKLFGLAPWAFRLVNILSHAVSVLLVWAIVFRLSRHMSLARAAGLAGACPERGRRIAFLASSLFAVHPIIVESVAWISGGIYCQYGMLFLLSFFLYIKGKELDVRNSKLGGEDRRRLFPTSSSYRLSSSIVFLFSLLFSEKASVLFLLFLLYELCFGNLKEHWKKLIPYFILSIGFIVFYLVQIPGRVVGVAQALGTGDTGLYNPLIQLPVAITSYFELVFWPSVLTLYHSEMVFTQANYIVRLLVFLGYCAAIILTAIKNRKLCFWLLWFLIPLIPTLTPLKIAWIVAERYAYLSVIGIFVLIAYEFEWVINYIYTAGPVSRFPPRIPTRGPLLGAPPTRVTRFLSLLNLKEFFSASRALTCSSRFSLMCSSIWIIILCIYLALITRTIIRNRDWTSEDTLWIATAQTSPSIPYTWNNMGDVYSRHGDYEKAADMFQRAISINPTYADAYHNLGETYRIMGEVGDAILMYEKALTLNPTLWKSHKALAGIYYTKKDYKEALFHIEEALTIVPDNQMLILARDEIGKMLK